MNDPKVVDTVIADLPKMATAKEVADALRVEPPTISRWVRAGALRGMRVGSRTLRVRKEDLREFLLGADEMNLTE